MYHDPALVSFKIAMTNITQQNCDAVYVFSTFLVAYAWASSDGTGNLFFSDPPMSDGGENTAEWVRLLRGCRTLLEGCYDWVMAGHSKIFMQLYNEQPAIFDLPDEDAAKFAVLETLCMYNLFRFTFIFRTLGAVISSHLHPRNVLMPSVSPKRIYERVLLKLFSGSPQSNFTPSEITCLSESLTHLKEAYAM
jgi:hypothetical protein